MGRRQADLDDPAAVEPANDGFRGIKSIDVAFRLLLAMERGRGPLALSEIAREAGLHPAKAHRYMSSLVRTGLASQDSTRGLYDLGPAARELGVEALRRLDPIRVASNFALELRNETGHTVYLAVWSESGPTLVSWDTGDHRLSVVIRVGSILPILDSAVGHAFLGHLPRSITNPVIRAQQREGTTRQLSAREIDDLREAIQGGSLAETETQWIIGQTALATPVFGSSGGIELILGVVLPARHLSDRINRHLRRQLSTVAKQIEYELGAPRPR